MNNVKNNVNFINKYLQKKQCIFNNVANNVLFIYVRIVKKK
jgi:hypothetical protein